MSTPFEYLLCQANGDAGTPIRSTLDIGRACLLWGTWAPTDDAEFEDKDSTWVLGMGRF